MQFDNIINFLHLGEKLKTELRHCWLSDGRRESVADHSWRLSLMVMLYADKLEQPVNVEKCLKMAIIHDIVEAEAGDVPVHCSEPNFKAQKKQREDKAIENIRGMLKSNEGDEIFGLWHEYEEKSSYEAKFVNALDKIEAFVAHLESDLSSWLHKEKVMVFEDKWKIKHCDFDKNLLAVACDIRERCIDKLRAAGEDIEALQAESQ